MKTVNPFFTHTWCRYYILLGALLFLFPLYVFSEPRTIRITVIQKTVTLNKSKRTEKIETFPLYDQLILGFLSTRNAQKFVDAYNDGSVPETEVQDRGDVPSVRTDLSGKTSLSLPLTGSVVWISSASGEAKRYGIGIDGEINIVDEVINGDEKETKLEEVVGKGELAVGGPDTISSEIIGKDIIRRRSPFKIPPDLACSYARFGLSPVFICVEDPSDTLCFYRPFVKDGQEYHSTQSRRMEFDVVKHDTLSHPRSLDSTYMQNHKSDTIWYSWHVRKKDIRRHYRVLADYWCEDYNGITFHDTIQIDHGRNRNKLRFLDFKLDSMHIDIDTKRYHIEGKVVSRNQKLSLPMEFLYNSADLRPESATNRNSIRRLMREFKGVLTDESVYLDYSSVKAVGIASPDGKVAGNRNLALRRANTFKELMRDSLHYVENVQIRDSIAPWTAVADTLMAMGDTVRANVLRQIVSQYKDLDQQFIAVRNHPNLNYQEFLRTEIMPKFCQVSFSYSYQIKRQWDREEIIDKYEHDREFRDRETKEHYQYEALFDYLKDRLPELEEQSKKAYFALNEYEGENEYYRPWPLAAYVYANSLLKSGRTDLDDEPYEGILWPFMSISNVPLRNETYRVRRDHGFVQFWNDDAIVVTMIGMYFQSGDIMKARWMAMNYLNKSLQKTKYKDFMTFLNCYGNEEDPEIIKAVARTSDFNKAVIYAAQDEKKNRKRAEPYLRNALTILQDTVFQNDPRAKYLSANIKYRLYGPINGQVPLLDPFIDESEGKDSEEIEEDLKWELADFKQDSINAAKMGQTLKWRVWKNQKIYGLDMVQACLMKKEFLEELRWDGYFSDEYRKAFFFYFSRKQEGLSDSQIKIEWHKARQNEKK